MGERRRGGRGTGGGAARPRGEIVQVRGLSLLTCASTYVSVYTININTSIKFQVDCCHPQTGQEYVRNSMQLCAKRLLFCTEYLVPGRQVEQ